MTAQPAPSALPYATAAEHLFDYLERASWVLGATRPPVEQMVARDELIAQREAGTRLPLHGLRTRARLELPATHLLVMAAIPGLNVILGEQLAARIAGATPTVQELITLLAFAAEDEAVLLAAFAPDAPLRTLGLVELGGDDRARDRPLLHRMVHVDDRLIAFLRGDDLLDPTLRDVATLDVAAPTTADAAAAEAIAQLVTTPGPIVVEGPARVGKTAAVVAALASLGRRTLVADLEVLVADPKPLPILERLRREALLLDAALVLRVGDAEPPPPVQRQLIAFAQTGIAIVVARAAEPIARALRGPRRVRVDTPPATEQQLIWRQALAVSSVSPAGVCERYPLPPGEIVLAAAAARAHSEVERRPVREDDLFAAARGRLCHRLGDVAEYSSRRT